MDVVASEAVLDAMEVVGQVIKEVVEVVGEAAVEVALLVAVEVDGEVVEGISQDKDIVEEDNQDMDQELELMDIVVAAEIIIITIVII